MMVDDRAGGGERDAGRRGSGREMFSGKREERREEKDRREAHNFELNVGIYQIHVDDSRVVASSLPPSELLWIK